MQISLRVTDIPIDVKKTCLEVLIEEFNEFKDLVMAHELKL